MASKKERRNGFLQGMNFMARINEVAFLSMVNKVVESGEYKKDYDTVKEFIKEELGITYQAYLNRTEAMRALGPEITAILVSADLHLRDVKMIEHMMTDEQKASLKKGVLEIGERKIPINEAHSEDIHIAVLNLIESADLARKAEKTAKKDLESLKKEYDKDSAPIKKELDALKALLTPDTPEKLLAAFEVIEKQIEGVDLALRTLVWKTPYVKDDPSVQAKVEAMQVRVEKLFEHFRGDWDVYCNNGEE